MIYETEQRHEVRARRSGKGRETPSSVTAAPRRSAGARATSRRRPEARDSGRVSPLWPPPPMMMALYFTYGEAETWKARVKVRAVS